MPKLVLNDLGSLANEQSALSTINTNSQATETALENTLSRDGTSPNQMNADLDMNSNQILNLPAATTDTEPVRKGEFDEALEELGDASVFAAAAEASAAEAAASAAAAAAVEGDLTQFVDDAEAAATAAEASETAAAASASSASTSASTATTQASNAATSASTATTQASNAATSASTATTQASNAATSASTASTAATNAQTAETNAETAEANAEAAATAAAASAAQLIGTSTTSNSIATGSKSFTTQSGKFFAAGTWLLITSDADPDVDYMHGVSTSYSGTSLTVEVTNIGGSGTHTDWTIRVAGTRGATGAAGSLDFTALVDTAIVAADTLVFGDVSDSENPKKRVASSLITDLSLLTTSTGQPLDSTLTALAAYNTNGLITQTAADTFTGRTITGTSNQVNVSNGNGVSGNPTLSLPQDIHTSANPQFATIELGAASDTTISRTDAGAIAVEGVGVALNSTSLAHTAGTIELGHASDTTLARSAAGIVTVEGTPLVKAGRQTIFLPATAMISRTTNGAAAGSVEMTTNKNMFKTLDFDATTQEFAQFTIWFPKSWDLGTVTFQPVWSHASTTTNFGVVFGLAAVARSDDDAGDVAFGTAQTSTDTGGTTNDIYLGPESSAITIAGTPAAEDTVQFQINRTVADGSDTMAIDARLHGVRLFYTTNAATDA